MKRWALAVFLALPLPFAALPLVAVLLHDPSPGATGPTPLALELSLDAPSGDSATESASLGFRIADPAGAGCEGLHAGS